MIIILVRLLVGIMVSLFLRSLENSYDYISVGAFKLPAEYINKLNSFISIVLNLSQDHLERHRSLENYFEIKEKYLIPQNIN